MATTKQTTSAVAPAMPVASVGLAFSHSLRVVLADGTAVDLVPVGLRVAEIPVLRQRVAAALEGVLALARQGARQPAAEAAPVAAGEAEAPPQAEVAPPRRKARQRGASAASEEF